MIGVVTCSLFYLCCNLGLSCPVLIMVTFWYGGANESSNRLILSAVTTMQHVRMLPYVTLFVCLMPVLNPLAGRATFLSPTVHGRSDNIVVFP